MDKKQDKLESMKCDLHEPMLKMIEAFRDDTKETLKEIKESINKIDEKVYNLSGKSAELRGESKGRLGVVPVIGIIVGGLLSLGAITMTIISFVK
jgi:tetrahydromethanopterin S-methyltransferase subunit G